MPTTRRRFLTTSAAALALPALSRGARAQAWPAGRPIRAIAIDREGVEPFAISAAA